MAAVVVTLTKSELVTPHTVTKKLDRFQKSCPGGGTLLPYTLYIDGGLQHDQAGIANGLDGAR